MSAANAYMEWRIVPLLIRALAARPLGSGQPDRRPIMVAPSSIGLKASTKAHGPDDEPML
jgi:hypothetical protein